MYGHVAPASGLQEGIFSYSNIYRCYLKCRKNKRNTINALKFEINAEENITKLERELKQKTYSPSRSLLFAAQKPKLREIFAADFRDRVVHHILIDYLEKIWEPIFIYDSYSCRNSKGTHKAIIRLQKFLRQLTRNGNIRAYYLQLDIKDFFTSIDKFILFDLIKTKINDPDILWLAKTIIFWDCTTSFIKKGNPELLENIPFNKSLFGKRNLCGLPIGNLTSQFFANVYLNSLDQFIKHQLKVKYYMRYTDDFILLSQDKEELSRWKNEIKDFLAKELNLQLHPRRQKLQPVSNGIDFLGYIIRHNYILVRRRVINNLKTQLKELKFCPGKLQDSIASYLGHFRWAN
ncbi:MAG: reverse transcriptase/maturase family protein, partial [Candidatus Omnitrophica bacterium]|nr:reverse transcriptase/maturase family protein [Candidatus Omnitrophota bacterium]